MARTKGAHSEATPVVRDGKLYIPVRDRHIARVGSRMWFSWLNGRTVASGHYTGNRTNRSAFYFQDGPLTMSCVLQRRTSRGNDYEAWMGYRTYKGKRRNVYLGKSENLTLEYLQEKALKLTE